MLINVFTPEALIILDSEELKLVQSVNTEKNRLAFAVMLKFFQTKGRYPTKKDTIDPMIVYSLANQLKVSPVLFEALYLRTRVSARFRQKIREYLGYSIAKLSDAETLIIWLMEQMKNEPFTMPQYREKAYQFFKEHKLEPFTPERTDRYIRSAIHRFEKQFFIEISKQLSSESIILMNNLLSDDTKSNDEKKDNYKDHDDEIILRCLKADIAGVKLKHVAFEIKKLTLIRNLPIPTAFFDSTPRKLLKKYYQRIMAASPSNILEFVPDARYATMACFIYIRSQLLTDDMSDLFIKLIHNMGFYAQPPPMFPAVKT